MTKQDAIDWIKANLPTETPPWADGERVTVEHDTDGETDCSICGRPHDPTTEYHPVDSLAEKYHDAMDSELPDPASDVAKMAIDKAKEQGTGHERFFEQAR